jgi:serine/threonine-protein kinase RsbW
VQSDAAQLAVVTQFLQEFWRAAELPPSEATAFELALEEIFMNVVMHGSPPGHEPRIEVSLEFCNGEMILTIEDDGPPFDPLSLPPPDVTASLEERRVGGLGVFLVRQMMDEVSYQRTGKRNQLRASKGVAPPATSAERT